MNIATLLDIYNLKDEKRTVQQLYSIENPDSIAGHTWGVAFLSLVYAESNCNMEKVLKMSLVHDIAESYIGDFADRVDDERREITRDEKQKIERDAVNSISDELDEEVEHLWTEYEERETSEARFVKDMDMLESCLQALRKEHKNRYKIQNNADMSYKNLDEFFATSEGRFMTEKGQRLFELVKSQYEKAKKGHELGWRHEKLELSYEAFELKDEARTGWELREVIDPETVAAHSWGSALQLMLNKENKEIDELKSLKMALVHDLEQAEVGDIPSRGDKDKKLMSTGEKKRREMHSIKNMVPEELDHLYDLWEEHMQMETQEAKLVEDMEQVDMLLQALKYEKDGRYDPCDNPEFSSYEKMDEFFISADKNIQTDKGQQLFNKIKDKYEKVKTR